MLLGSLDASDVYRALVPQVHMPSFCPELQDFRN